jgi:arylsulfatase A-like enzyme
MNVLVITCDDLGRFLGSYGITTVQTPQLDELASDGMRFERAFCTAPQCSPSRASLFTGRYPQSNGVLGLAHPPFNWRLYPNERHLARELADAGYTTVALGKVHESMPALPHRNSVGHLDELPWQYEDALSSHLGFDEVVTAGALDGKVVAAQAIEHLERLAVDGRPFYLQVGFVEPHRLSDERDEPHTVGFLGNHLDLDIELGVIVPPYLIDDAGARRDMAELQGAVRYVDSAIGKVLCRLRELGLEQDTIVVFTTDHGLGLPRAKQSLYDPGLEVALIVRCPNRGWTGGRVIDELVSNVDIFPTLLDALGLPISERVQGRSLVALLDGRRHARRAEIFAQLTYHDSYHPRRCIRTERYKLIAAFAEGPRFTDPSEGWRPRSTPRTQRFVPGYSSSPLELYDLQEDPTELNNLAADPAYADVRHDLFARLHHWMIETTDPLLQGAVTSPIHHSAIAELTAASSSLQHEPHR